MGFFVSLGCWSEAASEDVIKNKKKTKRKVKDIRRVKGNIKELLNSGRDVKSIKRKLWSGRHQVLALEDASDNVAKATKEAAKLISHRIVEQPRQRTGRCWVLRGSKGNQR